MKECLNVVGAVIKLPHLPCLGHRVTKPLFVFKGRTAISSEWQDAFPGTPGGHTCHWFAMRYAFIAFGM